MSVFRSLLMSMGSSPTPPTPTQKIYGVRRATGGSNLSSVWERLGDNVGKVANATHDGTAVVNDFDSIYPWSDIITYNYDTTNETITAYYGDDNFKFDGSNGEVLTKIPEFYYKRYQEVDSSDNNTYEYIYITNVATEGYTKSEEFSVGRYLMSYQNTSIPRSRNGVKPITSVNLESARAYATTIGTNFCLLDYHYFLLQLLYLVEYADYNSQDKLGNGIQSGSTTYTLGGCDSLGMKSGCLSNNGTSAVIYRGIEDIFGHTFQTLDGIVSDYGTIMISYDPTKYTSNTSLIPYNYSNTNITIVSSGWNVIRDVSMNNTHSVVQLPKQKRNENIYNRCVCDAAYNNLNSLCIVQVGGSSYYGNGQNGLWCTAIANSFNNAYADMGYRIIKY